MKDRLKEIRRNHVKGKTQDMFADFLGISKSNLSSYEAGRRTPSDAVIQLICEKCDINQEWLIYGRGEMKKEKDGSFTELLSELEESDDDFIKSLITIYMGLDDDSKSALRKIAKGMAEKYKSREN